MLDSEKKRIKQAFIIAFRKNMNVTASAKAAGISTFSLYKWKNEDEEFSKLWDSSAGVDQVTHTDGVTRDRNKHEFLSSWWNSQSFDHALETQSLTVRVIQDWCKTDKQFSVDHDRIKGAINARKIQRRKDQEKENERIAFFQGRAAEAYKEADAAQLKKDKADYQNRTDYPNLQPVIPASQAVEDQEPTNWRPKR